MVRSIDPAILAALTQNCSYLGGQFEPQGYNRLLATAHSPPRLLFAKCAAPAKQVFGEAMGLAAQERACRAAGMDVDGDQGIVPRVHTYGKTEDGKRAYLVTDYIDASGSGTAASQRSLGQKLALMHKHGASDNGKFGFDVPTHCGETELDNTWTDTWQEFYADRRIGDVIRRIGDSELTRIEKELRQHVYPLLLDTLGEVKPAILNGDLWSGNVCYSSDDNRPYIFDPSSYYAHNEMEIGMTHCFGGFSREFYKAYHEVYPKAEPAEYYDQRIELYKMFHWLNHTLIFGGMYKSSAMRSAQGLIDWAKKQKRGGARKAEL